MYEQLFGPSAARRRPPPPELVELSRDHLRRHDLLGKNTDDAPPIAFDLPPLHGRTLDEHFYRLGVDCAEPFLTYAREFAAANVPERPKRWVRRSGWTRYGIDGSVEPVESPGDDGHGPERMLCFDTEVMWKESPFPVMACAASPTAWYCWISPWLLGESDSEKHLVPLGDATKERIVVGHNVGYDRARVLEEYDLQQSRNGFLDTMSLHIAVNGMCSQQRPRWMQHKKKRELREKIATETDSIELAQLLENGALDNDEDEPWVERSSVNSLKDVAKFHLGVDMDKDIRDEFGALDREGVLAKLDELLDYCAVDVETTHKIFRIVFPNFLEVCPHPVSFAALRHLSSVILPVDESWDAYIASAESKYQELSAAVTDRLVALAEKAVEMKGDEALWSTDPWMKQLDWSGQEIKMVKGKKRNDPPRPAARQKKPGMPRWYKDLFQTNDSPMNISVRTRIAPLLLRLQWDGYPLFWSDKYGWTFRVPKADIERYEGKQAIRCDFDMELDSETDIALRNDQDAVYFKLPHKDGPSARCASPMAKGYLTYFEKGTLSSEYPYAKEAIEMNASCSYWISARDRVMSQMVVYEKDLPRNAAKGESTDAASEHMQAFILPQVIPMGTITRRAVENTWLTASNAKRNRVGSELKAMVRAPPGYCFVGADVDSEELWIASVVGDATFGIHGGNALGFMTLEGSKAAGTDLHSRTASILGITRNDAKVFNYGRIYGAGLRFAATLLRQFNPSLSERETLETATKLYLTTKGTRTRRQILYNPRVGGSGSFWRGGTESFVFNKLEEFADQERPRTPVLGAGITEALMSRNIGSKGAYLTSRINWAIQSSGVDYLHLLVVAMDHLIRRFGLKGCRLALTVHDEIRYLVRREDRYRAALALQVANLWTRAMFTEQVGILDLPQAVAYFSAVDIDSVLRKEVDMDCVTPSHPTPIPPGESLTIEQLLALGDRARLDVNAPPCDRDMDDRLAAVEYKPRVPVMQSLGSLGQPETDGAEEPTRTVDAETLAFVRAQIATTDEELRRIAAERRRQLAGLDGCGGEKKGRAKGQGSGGGSRPVSYYSSAVDVSPPQPRTMTGSETEQMAMLADALSGIDVVDYEDEIAGHTR